MAAVSLKRSPAIPYRVILAVLLRGKVGIDKLAGLGAGFEGGAPSTPTLASPSSLKRRAFYTCCLLPVRLLTL